uniref:Uncharacterized protein n=1 Tax=Arundo donax TaxID=35708 RepID=A0A0A9E8C2_ARUDO
MTAISWFTNVIQLAQQSIRKRNLVSSGLDDNIQQVLSKNGRLPNFRLRTPLC